MSPQAARIDVYKRQRLARHSVECCRQAVIADYFMVARAGMAEAKHAPPRICDHGVALRAANVNA